MDYIIVTGMSGSGKTKILNALEDIGYYCSDNIPPQFIVQFAEILHDKSKDISKIALVVDARGLNMFDEFLSSLDELTKKKYAYKLFFIDTDDKILFNRYKEGRRRHYLAEDESYSIINSIKKEREILKKAKEKAEFTIDTSLLSPSQLKRRVLGLVLTEEHKGLTIVCVSFGFKNGLPTESDLVFDLRCLPNPFYIPELKEQTGLDSPVSEYVMKQQESKDYYEKIYDILNLTIPLYVKEGKSYLFIAIGCTGGKHRSVTFVEKLTKDLTDLHYNVSALHRDVLKPNHY